MARVGGVAGPFVLAGLAAVAVWASGGMGRLGLALIPASLFFGLWAFDLLVAAGMAIGRRRGNSSGHYSSMVVLTGLLLFLWASLAGLLSGGDPQRWYEQAGTALAVGVVCLVLQEGGVRALDRVR